MHKKCAKNNSAKTMTNTFKGTLRLDNNVTHNDHHANANHACHDRRANPRA
jgi:hypothetical protein